MIEYDCEYFEDPVQLAKDARNKAILELIIDYVADIVNIYIENDIAVAMFLAEIQADVYKVHLRMIQSQPLFPNRGERGGEVLTVKENTSEVIIPASLQEHIFYSGAKPIKIPAEGSEIAKKVNNSIKDIL